MTKEEALNTLNKQSDMPVLAFDIVRELSKAYEAQLKAKDREIEELKIKRMAYLDAYIKCLERHKEEKR